jgi:hypothetical protein
MEIVRSIQGERTDEQATAAVMPQEDVDQYIGEADEPVVLCRERGRHLYPSTHAAGLRFVGVTEDGLMIRRLRCECCGLVDRVELWDVRQHRGRITRCELVSARPEYRTEYGTNGTVRRYTARPGHGRILPKRVRNALGTGQLAGQSYREVLKEARAGQKR